MSALIDVLDQTIELCARHKEALAEIVRLREENARLLLRIDGLEEQLQGEDA